MRALKEATRDSDPWPRMYIGALIVMRSQKPVEIRLVDAISMLLYHSIDDVRPAS